MPRMSLMPVSKLRHTNAASTSSASSAAPAAEGRGASTAAANFSSLRDTSRIQLARRECAVQHGELLARVGRRCDCAMPLPRQFKRIRVARRICEGHPRHLPPAPTFPLSPRPRPFTNPLAAPVLQHLDDYLGFVGSTYYQHSETGKSSSQWALIRRTTLGMLTAAVREPMVIGEEGSDAGKGREDRDRGVTSDDSCRVCLL